MSSGDVSGIISATSESSTTSGCSPLRMDVDSKKNVVRRHIILVDLVMRQLLLQEKVMSAFGRL